MQFDIEGRYDFTEGQLQVRAKHDQDDYVVVIEREVFEESFGTTASGDFHEYWSALLQHRAALEAAAAGKLEAGESTGEETIVLTPADLDHAS
ncbi:DUF1488 family protein [Oceanibacterium hippocampi]|uniref:DUF1488 domain-containing protein n=1 Tax=Oceanibacterium hippocampi TaxID=745714 RepID=A0A1Y5TVL4_9PROT|nr:DUF1488 family protein [Oceanibacterium hippocampi]SLN73841.1 hypothetical protein OCH7691_03673 [Oceanibacterium hippocampi]